MADFKAHLSRYIRTVRQGRPLTLLDRQTPVALVVPYSEKPGKLPVRSATRRPGQVKLPAPLKKQLDVVRYAAEERQRHR
jgi:antitoxin (DNA-binding transcriptional repressor) of toxin-antitoxin stability system